jgi:hypothetical protein
MFSQGNGYWDTNAIKSQVIPLNAEQNKTIQVLLPQGTTKFSYKIKVISQIGNVTYDFAEVFKNSADPRLALASQVTKSVVSSTEPKISYSIERIGSQRSLCYSSNGIIIGQVINYIDFQNRKCIDTDEDLNILNFYFKSENKIWPLKVVFEYVPFVEYELKRGWSKNLKNDFYNSLVNFIKQDSSNAVDGEIEKAVSCLVTNVIKDYTFEEFKSLAEFEKRNYLQKTASICDIH